MVDISIKESCDNMLLRQCEAQLIREVLTLYRHEGGSDAMLEKLRELRALRLRLSRGEPRQ